MYLAFMQNLSIRFKLILLNSETAQNLSIVTND